ncbi:MAG: GNVR domain-containing protein [candidate division WOR-3 bacterium]
MTDKKLSTISDYMLIILKWRIFIIRNVFIVTLLGILISIILPVKYTATATILPPSQEQTTMLGIISMGVPSELASLAKFAGGVPGLSSPSDLYAAIMKSSRIKSEIINKYNLKKEFRVKTMYEASKALDEITKISVSLEGIISVEVTYKNKFLAADIANSYVEELDKFNTTISMTVGKKYRLFVEQRLNETKDSLNKAEEALRKFQEEHRTVALDIEIQNAIETIAKLKSEIILREVQKGAVASASGLSNPYVANIEQELRELKRQLARIEFGTQDTTKKEFGAGFSVPFSRLPELSLEYARLLRDVKVQEAVYELLAQQYEQAKIMELKDTPTVQYLDKASPPERKSWPKRSYIVIFAFILGLSVNILLVFFLEYYNDIKNNPPKHTIAIQILKTLSFDATVLRSKIWKLLRKQNK